MVLFFIAGTLFTVGFYLKSAVAIILSVLSIICLIATFFVKLFKAKELKLFKLISIVVSFALAVIITVTYFEVGNNSKQYKGDYFITGEVAERAYVNDEYEIVVTLDNVVAVNYDTLEKSKLSGKLRLYLTQTNSFSLDFMPGEIIKGSVYLTKLNLVNDGRFNYNLFNRRIKTLGYASEGDIVSTKDFNSSVFDKFKIRVKDILDKNLSEEYSELGYTMLFGDKSGLDDEIKEIYSESGIAHLLAVSGLHVGFVVTLISAILGLFKVSDKFRFYFISIAVFLYAFLCGFSVSVTRAFIMTVVMLFLKMRNKEYDSLSSLSFAGLVILVINPLWIFDVGFQLSFGAVLGIILVSPLITISVSKVMGNKFASSLAVGVGATIGTTPIMAMSFSKVSLFSIITNMIVVPVASIAFMALFSSVIIACFIPIFGKVAIVFEWFMKFVTGVGRLSASTAVVCNDWITLLFTLAIIITCMFISGVIIQNRKARIISSSVSGAISVVLFILLFV